MNQNTSSSMPFFGLIRVSGEERTSFLHNQFSNDINNLPVGQACLATYNTAKGRVIATLLVLKRENDILLTLAADLCAAVLKKLQIYVLRSKVKLELMSEWGAAVSLPDQLQVIAPEPQYVLQTTHNNNSWYITLVDHSVIQLAKAEQLPVFDEKIATNWQIHAINSGMPWISAVTTETCVAQMLNLHQLGAVHFKKGCYPGQEIIARAQYRGQVKRGLVKLQTTHPLHDGEIIYNHNNEDVGLIINHASTAECNLALAVIKHSAAIEDLHTESTPLMITETFFKN